MKLTFITEHLNPTGGGAERSTLELCRELHHQGIDVTLVTGKLLGDHKQTKDFPVHSLSISSATRAGWWRRFERDVNHFLENEPADIIHSTAPLLKAHIYQPRGGSLLYSQHRHAASFSGVWIRTLKQITAGCNRGRAIRVAAEKRLCSDPNGPVIAALSEYVKQQFIQQYKMNTHRVQVVPGGIATDSLQSDQVRHDGDILRKRFDPGNKLALLVFAAVNFRLKGLDWLIKSAAHAAKQLTPDSRDFRLLVAGPDDYTRYWRQAQSLKLDNRVVFLGATEKMPALLAMADAVVLSSYNDACSRLILEGLALGKPGITTRFNGASDFLSNGKYGCVIDPCDDVPALADAILTICNRRRHSELCNAIIVDQIDQKVSMRHHVKQLIQLYRTILDQRPASS